MPAILAMTESLPGDADATLVIEIPDPTTSRNCSRRAQDQAELAAPACPAPAGDPALLGAEAAEIELPPATAMRTCSARRPSCLRLREVLAARGLRQDQMSPKAYWGRGRGNAGHGEPAKDA